MAALLVAVPARARPAGRLTPSTLFVTLAVIAPVAVLMLTQVRRGRWSNVDASIPSERPILFTVALGAMACALGWLILTDPRSFLVRGLVVVAAFVCAAAVLTRWIKLSLHVAFAAMTATALSLMGSRVGYGLVAVVPVLFWSRLALQRHRVHELVVGLVLGAITGVALVRG
jgi:hypothetical protein